MALPNFYIVDTTLREGEQFVNANFSSDDRVQIACALNDFGIDMIEIVSPMVSDQAKKDLKKIAGLGLKSKVVTHIRCAREDVDAALETGVDGLNMFIGTSPMLQKYGVGKNIPQIIDTASEVLTYARKQAPNAIIRFSTEDSFRSSFKDLLKVYIAIDDLNVVDRFGTADTVGTATPAQVAKVVGTVRSITDKHIEFHGHNDTGCAVANSYIALEAGATHIDTTVLGIGERNGICSLAGLIARLYVQDSEALKKKYNLKKFKDLHEVVSGMVGIEIATNHYIFGSAAFSHKAGIHTNAMLKNSKTYEAIDPADFGIERNIVFAHKLVGMHTIIYRAKELGIELSEKTAKEITQQIKNRSEAEHLTNDQVDEMIKIYPK